MATIEERHARGRTVYKTDVVVRVDGKRVKKSRTFSRRSEAAAWAKRVEREIRENGVRALERPADRPTVADAVQRYLDTTREQFGKTKRQVLRFVADRRAAFSDLYLDQVAAHDVLEFARELADAGVGPATVSSYLTHTCYVLANAEDDHGPTYRVDLNALDRGKRSARRNGYAGKPQTRDRRPTLSELDTILEYFVRRETGDPRAVPMTLVIPFAIFGLRRQSEIVGLRWSDLDGDEIPVRGAKHPRLPGGVDIVTELTPEAARVIELHGRRDPERVFPYSADVVSRLFTEAVRLCGVENLHFHDLRHEGVSWLLEAGWTTRHVMRVSGHSATQTLDRYSHLKQRGDKYENWHWWTRLEYLHGTD